MSNGPFALGDAVRCKLGVAEQRAPHVVGGTCWGLNTCGSHVVCRYGALALSDAYGHGPGVVEPVTMLRCGSLFAFVTAPSRLRTIKKG
jgi:hypothetical protein